MLPPEEQIDNFFAASGPRDEHAALHSSLVLCTEVSRDLRDIEQHRPAKQAHAGLLSWAPDLGAGDLGAGVLGPGGATTGRADHPCKRFQPTTS
jgi:hypothetical protein